VGEEGGGVCSMEQRMGKVPFLPVYIIFRGHMLFISTPGRPDHQELFLVHYTCF